MSSSDQNEQHRNTQKSRTINCHLKNNRQDDDAKSDFISVVDVPFSLNNNYNFPMVHAVAVPEDIESGKSQETSDVPNHGHGRKSSKKKSTDSFLFKPVNSRCNQIVMTFLFFVGIVVLLKIFVPGLFGSTTITIEPPTPDESKEVEGQPTMMKLSTASPTTSSSFLPSIFPSPTPTISSSSYPSLPPSDIPSLHPSVFPSVKSTNQPSSIPSSEPTIYKSSMPSSNLSFQPSSTPSIAPSRQPSLLPTVDPTTLNPSPIPSMIPTIQSSSHPSYYPSDPKPNIPTIYGTQEEEENEISTTFIPVTSDDTTVPCPTEEEEEEEELFSVVKLYVRTDKNPQQTYWDLKVTHENYEDYVYYVNAGHYTSEESLFEHTFNVKQNSCFELNIYDNTGDGLCCNHGQGYVMVYYDEVFALSGYNFQSYWATGSYCPP